MEVQLHMSGCRGTLASQTVHRCVCSESTRQVVQELGNQYDGATYGDEENIHVRDVVMNSRKFHRAMIRD